MNQKQRRLYLIEYLLGEQKWERLPAIPASEQGQRDMLRALMNVRPPKPIGADFLSVQDAYLQARAEERGITDWNTLLPEGNDRHLFLWRGDITTLRCGAIVNACNSAMLGCFSPMHACIDNFIHSYAGVQLRLRMNEIMQAQGHEEPTGQAKITPGYNLPADYILHTVGPIIYDRVTGEDERLLASCYRECLQLAWENGITSVAFCCLSTGVFRFPKRHAASIAIRTVQEWLNEGERDMKVIFNVFSAEDEQIYKGMLHDIPHQ